MKRFTSSIISLIFLAMLTVWAWQTNLEVKASTDGGTIPPAAAISVNNINPRPGEVVTITLTAFPANTWIHLDFGHPSPFNEIDVLTDDTGKATTTHTYGCGKHTIIAWPLDNASDVTSGPIVEVCKSVSPKISGPAVGKPGERIDFVITGTPNAEVSVQFGDGDAVIVTLNTEGKGSTWHIYALGIWEVSVEGGNKYTIQITEDGNMRLYLPILMK